MRRDTGDGVAILGGGPAGLATAWALEALDCPYTLLEAAPAPGGNARTLRFGDFRYDTGPHRFHDRDPGATRRVVELLGDDLRAIEAPSRIFWNGAFVDFPLRPLQALTSGGAARSLAAMLGLLRARLRPARARSARDFGTWATATFGRSVAEAFLIPFSEKLWGLPAGELSPEIAGRRLPGFTLAGIAREVLFGRKADHLEGRFLYPRHGYGQIVDAMAARLTPGRLRCGARVTRLRVEKDGVRAVEYESDGRRRIIEPAAVANTLPLTLVVRMVDPVPPEAVRLAAARLRFRDVILVALFFDQPAISDAVCTYFPQRELAFTRAHEPRNRSPAMSPPGKTSLVVEFPCSEGDDVWAQSDGALVAGLVRDLDAMGLVPAARLEASAVTRLRKAYPVYSTEYRELSSVVLEHLGRVPNLTTLGRGGRFFYGHVHDFIAAGFAAAPLVARFAQETP